MMPDNHTFGSLSRFILVYSSDYHECALITYLCYIDTNVFDVSFFKGHLSVGIHITDYHMAFENFGDKEQRTCSDVPLVIFS